MYKEKNELENKFEQLKKLQANLAVFTKRKETYESKIKDLNNRIKDMENSISAHEKEIQFIIMSEILGDVSFEDVLALNGARAELNNIFKRVINDSAPHKLLSKIEQMCQESSQELQEIPQHISGGVR